MMLTYNGESFEKEYENYYMIHELNYILTEDMICVHHQLYAIIEGWVDR